MNKRPEIIDILRERERERATLLNNGNDVASDLRVVHKNVGAASSCPQGKSICAIHRGEKGITLIALIVTVIILMILAMTSVSLVLRKNLIEKAKTAKEEYEQAAINEAEDLNTLENALLGGNTGGGNSGGGNIEGDTWVDNGDGTFTKGDTTIVIGQTTFENAEVLEALGETGGTYTGTWTVIGVEENILKLVSTKNVGTYTIGYNDPAAIEAIKEAELNNPTTEEKYQRAVWSYLNVEETFNDAVQEKTGIKTARSITLDDILEIADPKPTIEEKEQQYYWETNAVYGRIKEDDGEYGTPAHSGYSAQIFIDEIGNFVHIDKDNPENKITLREELYSSNRIVELGHCLSTGDYAIPSKTVSLPDFIYTVRYGIREMSSGALYKTRALFDSTKNHNTLNQYNVGLRAIIFI